MTSTQVLETDDTIAVPRAPAVLPSERKRVVGEAIPPAWAGKRLAMLLVPLIVIALLAWGLVAAIGGSTTTKAPSFVGLSKAQAEALAMKTHVALVESSAFSGAVPSGVVLKQSIPAGTTLRSGASVAITISSGPPPCCTVPDVRGLSIDDARKALAAAHLVLGNQSFTFTGFGKDGTVVSQNPAAGAHLSQGKSVDVIVFMPGGGGHGKHHGGD